jgi:hypothetical protein
MTTRRMYGFAAVLLAAGLLGACSSGSANDGATPAQQTNANTPAPDPAVATGATPTADDLCTVIPDLATIEAAIGVPVKDPLGVGAAGFQQTCMLLRATDDFPGITFILTPGGTIADQSEFVSNNYGIEIVPLDGVAGFYAGEGDSVYWEGNGNLYQASATIDGDSRNASLKMLQAWLAL